MDKPKPGELEEIAFRFSQAGAAGHNDPTTIMLADIIRRLSALEKMMSPPPNSCGYPGCTIGGGHSHPNWDGHGGAGVLGVARGLAGEGGIIP